jgi:hypothetical protein
MPHLLMSNGSLEAAPGPAMSYSDPGMQHFQRSREVDPDLEPLRRQVSDIIAAILADTKPEEAEVREHLRSHVAENPGQPEKALLNHLLSLSVREDIPAG